MDPDPENHMRILSEQITGIKQQFSALSQRRLESADLLLLPEESAKLHVSLAFTLSSLYYILLNSKGGGSHPIKTEISRIRQYVARMNQKNNLTQPQEQEKRRTRIDVDVVTRIVKHNTDHDRTVDDVKQPSKKQKR